MARPTTAQPVTFTLRTLAVVVATAVSGMSVYAQAATTSKEETITVTTAAPQENAWGPAATIAAKHTATATKTDMPLEKNAAVHFRRHRRRDRAAPAEIGKRGPELHAGRQRGHAWGFQYLRSADHPRFCR